MNSGSVAVGKEHVQLRTAVCVRCYNTNWTVRPAVVMATDSQTRAVAGGHLSSKEKDHFGKDKQNEDGETSACLDCLMNLQTTGSQIPFNLLPR